MVKAWHVVAAVAAAAVAGYAVMKHAAALKPRTLRITVDTASGVTSVIITANGTEVLREYLTTLAKTFEVQLPATADTITIDRSGAELLQVYKYPTIDGVPVTVVGAGSDIANEQSDRWIIRRLILLLPTPS